MKSKILLLVLMAIVFGGYVFYKYGRSIWVPFYLKQNGGQTVSQVVNAKQKSVESILKPMFKKVEIAYPPKQLVLLSFKDSKQLELWASDSKRFKLIKRYSIKAASGVLGPKLAEGDRQVPEGIYKIEGFNPNSSYHLSMKLNYPNQFDSKWAKKEGRNFPGSNIFIHGKAVSIGCLAMGDAAIEELFVLSRLVGKANIKVIISPSDPVLGKMKNNDSSRPRVTLLYNNIEREIKKVRAQA
jgi:murein L,D-transpeptidase YafK